MSTIRKILFHTKHPESLASLEKIGSDLGYVFVPLPDISNLIVSVYDEMPHLVMVDLHRANVAGFETCKQLKTDAVLEHIPLIVLTDLVEISELPDSGADRVLARNESAEKLFAGMHNIIESSSHALDVNPLTRLPGSRSTVERIEAMIQRQESFAVCAIHLRHLNYFYRTFGSRRGDALVKRTLELISEACNLGGSGRSFVGHLGDRDFVTMLAPGDAVAFTEKVIGQFEARLEGVSATEEDGRTEGVVTLSIAIMTNEEIPFRHIAEVVRGCEQIHRFLKRYPHNAYLKDRRSSVRDLMSPLSFETGGKRPPLQQNIDPSKKRHGVSELLMSVAAAIHSGSTEAHFQPIVDWKGKVYAHEALSRFPGPDGKWIDPVKMFQAAREADLIRELDVACAVNALRCASALPPQTKIFVNLNRETLLDQESLEHIWGQGWFDTRRIVIEITEQSLVRQSLQLMRVMEGLRARGVQLALDDAGGGAVSLREAAELKPNFIKLDKSIIRDIHDTEAKRKIVLSLSVFAKSMDALTIAEGIETELEWNYLKNAGVDLGQGYLIGKPQASPVVHIAHLP